METVEFKYGSKTLHLFMSAEAMFRIQALSVDPEGPEILDLIVENSPAGSIALCQVAQILAESGELSRRYLGYSKERIPTVDELQQLLSPMQQLQLRITVVKTINSGYQDNSSNPDPGDIDLGLLELEKKTKL